MAVTHQLPPVRPAVRLSRCVFVSLREDTEAETVAMATATTVPCQSRHVMYR